MSQLQDERDLDGRALRRDRVVEPAHLEEVLTQDELGDVGSRGVDPQRSRSSWTASSRRLRLPSRPVADGRVGAEGDGDGGVP